jgi:hypothetical protein
LYVRSLTASLVAFGIGLAAAPAVFADPGPDDTAAPGAPGPQPPPDSLGDAPAGDTSAAASTACQQFGAGLSLAANNYGDFANNIAGDTPPNYADPTVVDSNVTGRTALRAAAGNALDAAGTPGLSPEVAGPMQAWSGGATKLLVLMGVHASRDAINQAASDLNNNTDAVQQACAASSGRL